jgi:hypothetical protein
MSGRGHDMTVSLFFPFYIWVLNCRVIPYFIEHDVFWSILAVQNYITHIWQCFTFNYMLKPFCEYCKDQHGIIDMSGNILMSHYLLFWESLMVLVNTTYSIFCYQTWFHAKQNKFEVDSLTVFTDCQNRENVDRIRYIIEYPEMARFTVRCGVGQCLRQIALNHQIQVRFEAARDVRMNYEFGPCNCSMLMTLNFITAISHNIDHLNKFQQVK